MRGGGVASYLALRAERSRIVERERDDLTQTPRARPTWSRNAQPARRMILGRLLSSAIARESERGEYCSHDRLPREAHLFCFRCCPVAMRCRRSYPRRENGRDGGKQSHKANDQSALIGNIEKGND
jgi:hypothetical protein